MNFKYSVIFDALAMMGLDVFGEPREILKKIREAGFDGVDIGGDRVELKRLREIADIARSLGLEVPAILGAWAPWHAGEERDLASSDDTVRIKAVNYAKKCVDKAVELGAEVFEICVSPGVNPYPVSKVPIRVLEQNFTESAADISRYALDRNITIILEPINRFEGYPGFMNSVVDAVRVLNMVGASNLGVLGDLFHMNIEDVSICDAIRAAGKTLRHIHLADSNRFLPGTGHVDFKSMIRTLTEVNFTGYMSLDCVPPGPDLETYLENSMSYMTTMEKAVELQKKMMGTP